MAELKEFKLQVFLDNGTQLQTEFSQMLEDGQTPATRFYLGYSSDSAAHRDLPWITVGDIAYLPEEVVAVKLAPKGAEEDSKLRAV